MKHQQAVYLQEMGITRWQVRKPNLFPRFNNADPVDLKNYSLLVICSNEDFQHPLMGKILSAFKFKADDVYHCSMSEFEDQQGDLPEYIWTTVGEINQPQGHKLLTSPSLPYLADHPEDKKSLWKQFCAFN